MATIEITMKSNKTKSYDLREKQSYVRGLITQAINAGNKMRLQELQQQLQCLVDENDNTFAVKELPRINEALNKLKKTHVNPLIEEIHLFPRSEFYTRFNGSTAFAMSEPKYWCTYHRSESSRFFQEAGGRKQAQFNSVVIKKKPGTHSFYAHTGGYRSPFSVAGYESAFSLDVQVGVLNKNIRDSVLCYKLKLAQYVVAEFESHAFNKQNIKAARKKLQSSSYTRPIVYYENGYPCILVALPVLNPLERDTEATRYWQEHRKPFQKLLICGFVALLNVDAMRAEVPIEMVLRASFGHNLPSICETDNSFRINLGIIPKKYAKLIGKALFKFNQMVLKITDEASPEMEFSKTFHKSVRVYNAGKLIKAIDENSLYTKLRGSKNYERAKTSEESLRKLIANFFSVNKNQAEQAKKTKKSSRKGIAIFTPVDLKNKTVWQVIRSVGDSMAKSVLSECFRQKGTEDWFINQVMLALLKEDTQPIETALKALLDCLRYDTTASMNYNKLKNDFKKPKRDFKTTSFKPFYQEDTDFSHITTLLFEAFSAQRPNNCLYNALDSAGTEFLKSARGSDCVKEDPDYGSDSEFDYSDKSTVVSKKKKQATLKFSHAKLRVCSGMKAILVAHYAALSYIKTEMDEKQYRQDVDTMYYEVEKALKLVDIPEMKLNKVRASETASVLHFDLNHCNAANQKDNTTLDNKLQQLSPSVVVLDYTSSTYLMIRKALQTCFACITVDLVLLVESGLKNEQGGLDINPYGEIRVLARTKAKRKKAIDWIKKGLSEQDKLPVVAHEKVRACKKRGLAPSLYGFFKCPDEGRFSVVEDRNIAGVQSVAAKKF